MTGAKLKKRFLLNKTNDGDPTDTVALDAVSSSDNMATGAINQVSTENSEKELIPPVRLARLSRDALNCLRCFARFGTIFTILKT